MSFSPRNYYTVSEGSPVELTIVLDKPSVKNITITVTTMDITAQCEMHNLFMTNYGILTACYNCALTTVQFYSYKKDSSTYLTNIYICMPTVGFTLAVIGLSC